MAQIGDVSRTVPSSLEVSRVPPEALVHVWPQIAPMVRRGIHKNGAGDTLSERQLIADITSGAMELWAVHDGREIAAGIVLQVLRRERGKVLSVVMVAGRDFTRHAEHVQALLREYAELLGAYTIEAVVRDGMTRWLKQMGWRRKATIMEL